MERAAGVRAFQPAPVRVSGRISLPGSHTCCGGFDHGPLPKGDTAYSPSVSLCSDSPAGTPCAGISQSRLKSRTNTRGLLLGTWSCFHRLSAPAAPNGALNGPEAPFIRASMTTGQRRSWLSHCWISPRVRPLTTPEIGPV